MTPDIDSARTALLVMDYQNGIMGRVSDGPELLAAAQETIGLVRDAGGQIGQAEVIDRAALRARLS